MVPKHGTLFNHRYIKSKLILIRTSITVVSHSPHFFFAIFSDGVFLLSKYFCSRFRIQRFFVAMGWSF